MEGYPSWRARLTDRDLVAGENKAGRVIRVDEHMVPALGLGDTTWVGKLVYGGVNASRKSTTHHPRSHVEQAGVELGAVSVAVIQRRMLVCLVVVGVVLAAPLLCLADCLCSRCLGLGWLLLKAKAFDSAYMLKVLRYKRI